ncbi:MAG: response regulator transcription factor [Proteobacteria bacterium]|nr:response regulator transcription factor [Pseudomonadota bacterium]
MARILFIEDEPDLVPAIVFTLGREGFDVHTAGTMAEGRILAEAVPGPDLVVLDWMLPDGSGVDLCRALRADEATEQLPVLLLTARASEADRVAGLEAGVDDYMTKPFSVQELARRIRTLLARVADQGRPLEDRVAWVREHGGSLAPSERRVLGYLVERGGRLVRRSELDVLAQGEDEAPVGPRAVDPCVQSLRQRLGPPGQAIEVLPGVGYRLDLARLD